MEAKTDLINNFKLIEIDIIGRDERGRPEIHSGVMTERNAQKCALLAEEYSSQRLEGVKLLIEKYGNLVLIGYDYLDIEEPNLPAPDHDKHNRMITKINCYNGFISELKKL
jgi:hypothetical protein